LNVGSGVAAHAGLECSPLLGPVRELAGVPSLSRPPSGWHGWYGRPHAPGWGDGRIRGHPTNKPRGVTATRGWGQLTARESSPRTPGVRRQPVGQGVTWPHPTVGGFAGALPGGIGTGGSSPGANPRVTSAASRLTTTPTGLTRRAS